MFGRKEKIKTILVGKRLFLNKISKSLILTICPERTARVPVFKTQTQLDITSEFNEVDFSERRNFEASHKIPTSKNKFGWRNLQGFGTVKFLLNSPNRIEF